MKHFMLAVALTATPAVASVADREYCEEIANGAEIVMQHRQATTPITDVLEMAEHDKMVTILARIAYKHPAYATKKHRERAVREFKSEIYISCLNAKEKAAS